MPLLTQSLVQGLILSTVWAAMYTTADGSRTGLKRGLRPQQWLRNISPHAHMYSQRVQVSQQLSQVPKKQSDRHSKGTAQELDRRCHRKTLTLVRS